MADQEAFRTVTRDREFADYLDQEFLVIRQITIVDNVIRAVVQDLIVLNDHPRYPGLGQLDRCTLVFEGVVRSQRRLATYADGNPHGGAFTGTSVIEDGPFPPMSGEVHHYILEGVMSDPCAWLGWDLHCVTYRIETDRTPA